MRFIRRPSEDTPRGHARDALVRMILSRGYKVGQKLPTYRDLAAHFGIAVRTIQRVMQQLSNEGVIQLLHGKGAFVRKLPVTQGQLGEIGLVYPASRLHLIQTPYLNAILSGVITVCDTEQIDLQIVALHQAGRAATEAVPARDIVLRVDGVILLGVVNEAYIDEFVRESIPLILADAQSRNNSIASISIDNAAAVDLTMDHLYHLGHRCIAYLDARSQDDLAQPSDVQWVDSFDTRERREAYQATCRRLGLDYERIYEAIDNHPGRLTEIADAFRRDRQRPSAILTYDESAGVGLCRTLLKNGLRIPRDISVVGAVGTTAGSVIEGHLLTCGIADFQEMGAQAVTALRAQAGGGRIRTPRLQRISCTLQAGTTSGKP